MCHVGVAGGQQRCPQGDDSGDGTWEKRGLLSLLAGRKGQREESGDGGGPMQVDKTQEVGSSRALESK